MKALKSFIKGLALFFFNSIVNRIPICWLRLFFMRRYMHIGKTSNVMCGVKLLKEVKRENIVIGNNCIINNDCLLDGRQGKIVIGNNVDLSLIHI